MIEEAQQHKNEAIRLQNFELAASFRDRENQYTEQLERLKNEWKEKLKDNRETVDAPQIEEVVSMISGVPVQRMAQAEGVRLKGMKQALLSKVIGQDKAVETLVRSIQRSRVGLKDPNKPIGTFLFLGPTGVGKTHLERNDFIIEKQKAELQRMDAAKRHKEEQINLAEQELKQVKSEIRTDKLKKTATTAATAITSGVASLFGSGKLKELERANEKLQDEVSKRNTNIEKLQSQVQQMQKQHDTQIHNLREMHRQELDMKEKELSRLARIIDKAFRWFPMFREMLR